MPRVTIHIDADDIPATGLRVTEEGRIRCGNASDLAAVPEHLGVAVRRVLLAVAGLSGYDAAARVVVGQLGLNDGVDGVG